MLRRHSSKQTEAISWTRRRRADYRYHCRFADIALTMHHHCHISLDTTTTTNHQLDCRCRAPRRSPKEGKRHTKVPPMSDHMIKGFPWRGRMARSVQEGCSNKAEMPPGRLMTATTVAIAGHSTKTRQGVHPSSDTTLSHTIPHRCRQARHRPSNYLCGYR